jgi:hypothetical protein
MKIKYVMKYEMIFTVYWGFNLVAGKRARGAEKVLKFYKSLIKLN